MFTSTSNEEVSPDFNLVLGNPFLFQNNLKEESFRPDFQDKSSLTLVDYQPDSFRHNSMDHMEYSMGHINQSNHSISESLLYLQDQSNYLQFMHQTDLNPSMMSHSNFESTSHYINEQISKPETRTKTFHCDFPDCGKQFKKHHALNTHKKVHSGDQKPFVCNVCSWSFSRSHDLKRHEYIHSKYKPFICEECNRGFSRRDALKRHLDSWKSRQGGCNSVKKKPYYLVQ
ncbi:hypothetical protein BC833DRAFT_588739 [Globomyces pollinis-pini]|nr:hypothetical protein BC833DRAFT_588739 [Globomyces pollinis-pini]